MSRASRVVIVTSRADVTADRVQGELTRAGVDFFRLNLDEFPVNFELSLAFAEGKWSGAIEHRASGEALDLAQVGAVWLRKPAPFVFPSPDLGAQERAFATDECNHVLLGWLYSLDQAYWMSHPLALRGASWKVEQLSRAARLGFRVPPSLVTNQPDSARRFAERDVVFKALSSCTLGAEDVAEGERVATGLRTTRITAAHLPGLAAVAEGPCFFQEHVPKQHELRVTVIGGRAFAARIHSQLDPRTALDFRDFSVDIPFERAELDPLLERRCLDFVHSYGLTYGALDLIVPPDGEPVFLENNPNGQFLFVEELVPELQLCRAVAECLRDGLRARARA